MFIINSFSYDRSCPHHQHVIWDPSLCPLSLVTSVRMASQLDFLSGDRLGGSEERPSEGHTDGGSHVSGCLSPHVLGSSGGLAYHPVWGSNVPHPDGFFLVLGQGLIGIDWPHPSMRGQVLSFPSCSLTSRTGRIHSQLGRRKSHRARRIPPPHLLGQLVIRGYRQPLQSGRWASSQTYWVYHGLRCIQAGDLCWYR